MIFAPAVTCVFTWGVFWKRGTKEASLLTLAFGSLVGMIYFIFDLPLIGDVRVVSDNWGIPFMQVGFYLFLMCSVVYYITSRLTPAPTSPDLDNLCWKNPIDALFGTKLSSVSEPRAIGLILFCLVIILYMILG